MYLLLLLTVVQLTKKSTNCNFKPGFNKNLYGKETEVGRLVLLTLRYKYRHLKWCDMNLMLYNSII